MYPFESLPLILFCRTAECIARFIEPLTTVKDEQSEEPPDWLSKLTESMSREFAMVDRNAPREIEKMIHTANSGRIYFEQLHLHPVRLSLTFTQEWMEWNPGSESMMLFQFIRGMVCYFLLFCASNPCHCDIYLLISDSVS